MIVLACSVAFASLLGWVLSDPRSREFYEKWAPKDSDRAFWLLRILLPGLAGVFGWLVLKAFRSDVLPGPSAVRGLIAGALGFSAFRFPLNLLPLDGSAEFGSILNRAALRVELGLQVKVMKRIGEHVLALPVPDLCKNVRDGFEIEIARSGRLSESQDRHQRAEIQRLCTLASKGDGDATSELRGHYKYLLMLRAPDSLRTYGTPPAP
jgi:hypothetical protein